MNAPNSREAFCVYEGCARPAEPGERYCAPCGLERSLFDRDARRRHAAAPAEREPQPRRA
ncbi:MAG TPA: hypothetical protein VIB08_04270 [Thermoanaerobaculia bacterium]